MTKTGTNDVSCVVWTLGKFFFFSFHVLLVLTTTIIRYNLCFSGLGKASKTKKKLVMYNISILLYK